MNRHWHNTTSSRGSRESEHIRSKSYTCGYCGNALASDEGYFARDYTPEGNSTGLRPTILICHFCANPTYFIGDEQTPGSAFGGSVAHLPVEVEGLYEEARNCMKVNAYTAAVMCCRKLLMNIAVERGAKEGMNFWQYVNYLSDENFVPPDGKEWVDLIREKGNVANHKIPAMYREDAEELITFTEMLLRFNYEFPARMKARVDKVKAPKRSPSGFDGVPSGT